MCDIFSQLFSLSQCSMLLWRAIDATMPAGPWSIDRDGSRRQIVIFLTGLQVQLRPASDRGRQHMKHLFSAALTMILVLGLSYTAAAQTEVTVIGPGGVRAAVEKLIPGFEAKTGYKVKSTYGSGGGTHAQVVKGDIFDVVIVQPPFQDVIASGNVMKDTEKELAAVPVGVAVKKGAPRPDISSAAAVKKMLLDAKSVSYPNPSGGAAAGVSFERTLKQ